MPDLVGKTLGPYRILDQIGTGGMAVVYKAYQPSMDRYIAIKIIPEIYSQDEQFVKRFQREARAVARLQHAHILPVYDYGEQDGIAYLTMRFVEAGTLRKRMANGPLTFAELNHFIGQIGNALDYAHRMGVVHRDVKPSNILVDDQDNTYLTDFGVASILNATQQLTAMGVGIGTPAYVSPEQGQGLPVDNRADIYSLGVILYEMVTGRVPFEAETPMAVIYKHIHAPLPLPHTIVPDLPDPVERVILKALAKAPADRFQTADEMVTALAVAISKASHTATRPHKLPSPAPSPQIQTQITRQHPTGSISRRAPILIGILLTGLVLCGVLLSQVPYRLQIAGDQVEIVNPNLVTSTQELQPGEATVASATTPYANTPQPSLTPAPTVMPNFSPGQGLKLDECNNNLCIIYPDGATKPLGLGNAYTYPWGSSWSPDGSRIVFAACPVLEVLNKTCSDFLFITDSDGSNVTLLLNDSPGKWQSPAWSPDGEWIACWGGGGLFLIRPDGSDKTLLAPIPGAWLKSSIAWSPDSKQIAVFVTLQHSDTGLADAVWVLNADGSGRIHSILDSDVPMNRITWTPDGRAVVVVLENGTIYQIEADCDSQPAGCNASARLEVESIPEQWFPNFYPQWAGEASQPTSTATNSP